LAALIGEHLFGHAVFCHGCAVHLQDVLGRLAAKYVQPYHVAGVVIEKPDQVGVLASQAEGEDVRLPHLVGCGALEEAWLRWIALRFGLPFRQELLLVERAANGFPTHGKKQHPPQELADLLDPKVGMPTLELDDVCFDRRCYPRSPATATSGLGLQAGFTLFAVRPHPLGQGAETHAHLAGHPL
jgi:hypothetical protein